MMRRLLLLSASAALSHAALAQVPAPPSPPPELPREERGGERARVVGRDVAAAARAGNEAILGGRLEEARRSYERAQVLAPELPELEYNRGLSLLLSQDVEGAKSALEQSLSLARPGAEDQAEPADPGIERDGLYNLGHAALAGQDLPNAARRFAQALAADPESEDARRNLELALRSLRVQQQQEQEQEQDQQRSEEEDQEEQDQEEQEQDDPSEQEQEDESEESEPDGEGEEQEEDEEPSGGELQPDPSADEEPNEPQPRPGQMSREQVEQLLDSLAEEEREALRREQEAKSKSSLPAPGGKDW